MRRLQHFFLGFLAAALLLLASCSAPKPLEYRGVEGFRISSVSLNESKLELQVRFFNPNAYSLQLKGGDIDVFLNDKYVGKSSVEQRTLIPGKNDFLLPIMVTADMKILLGNALQVLVSQKVIVHLKGSVKAGKGGVFVRVPVDWVTEQRFPVR